MQIFFLQYTLSVESAYFVLNRTLIIVVQLIIEAIIIRIFMTLKLAFEPFVYQLLYTIKFILDLTAEIA